jgi:hypothetical protein
MSQRAVPQLVERRGLAEDRRGPLAEQVLGPLVRQPGPAPLVDVTRAEPPV